MPCDLYLDIRGCHPLMFSIATAEKGVRLGETLQHFLANLAGWRKGVAMYIAGAKGVELSNVHKGAAKKLLNKILYGGGTRLCDDDPCAPLYVGLPAVLNLRDQIRAAAGELVERYPAEFFSEKADSGVFSKLSIVLESYWVCCVALGVPFGTVLPEA